jgi:hypothetical protein
VQKAWSAITHTRVPADDPAAGSHPCQHLINALDNTTGAGPVAGALLGARWGASAIPFGWQRTLHGPTGTRSYDLVRLAIRTVLHGGTDRHGWPAREHYPTFPTPAPPRSRIRTTTVSCSAACGTPKPCTTCPDRSKRS